jgi:hypothetical protein
MISERQEANADDFSSPNSTSEADALSPTETMISPTEKDFNKDRLDKLTEECKISPDQAEVSSSHLIAFTSKAFLTPPTISIFSAFIISFI